MYNIKCSVVEDFIWLTNMHQIISISVWKLRSMEELSKEKRWIHHAATVPVTEEKLSQIQKEIEDQEVIIQGYQQVYHTAFHVVFWPISERKPFNGY